MQINLKIEGLDKVRAQLGGLAKQANFAAKEALNITAFAIRDQIKKDMDATFKGGATNYSLRAFNVKKAQKKDLAAEVYLRTDTKDAALSYNKALAHLFTGGPRNYKKAEGWLRANAILPRGLNIAPGNAMKLDRFGNMNRSQLSELMGMLIARPSTMRLARKTGKGKAPKLVDYFVIKTTGKSHLHPGIYKRIETGKTSAVDAMILFLDPANYRKFIDLEKLGTDVFHKRFQPAFEDELIKALATAKQ